MDKNNDGMGQEQDASYFLEWGHVAWRRLLDEALQRDLGPDFLRGKRVLEIGTRYGKMACYFALMGADSVVGIDLESVDLTKARDEAKKHGVESKVDFINYDGDLDVFPDGSFDFIFTKSVLVVVPEMETFLGKLQRKLSVGGRALFLENARGGFAVEVLRRIRHRKWNYDDATMFEDEDLARVERHLRLVNVSKVRFPPIYKIVAAKPDS